MAKANETKKVEATQAAEEHQGQVAEEAATETVETPSETVEEPKTENPVAVDDFKTMKVTIGKEFTHVNVRMTPNDKAKVKDLLARNAEVEAKPAKNGFFELKLGGYVKAEFLE